jgi:hypothetical protein
MIYQQGISTSRLLEKLEYANQRAKKLKTDIESMKARLVQAVQLLLICKQREYNGFEPDNQSALYKQLEAEIPKLMHGIPILESSRPPTNSEIVQAHIAISDKLKKWHDSINAGEHKQILDRLQGAPEKLNELLDRS